jgi:hypothetical protein
MKRAFGFFHLWLKHHVQHKEATMQPQFRFPAAVEGEDNHDSDLDAKRTA